MATIEQIVSSVLGGGVVTIASWTFFGTAVRFGGNSNLTPRAWSRPREVLKNVLSAPYAFNWIIWAVRLKYIDMLVGIPGTGTRMKGWSGPPLKANLDAVIAMRFQSLQLKVSILTTVLCMFMLLPLFITTTCDPIELGLQSCINQQNLTNFEMTTIANVPALAFNPVNGTVLIEVNETDSIVLVPRNEEQNALGWQVGLTGRYMAVVIVMGMISYYTCYLLWFEWVECLALRRVYYLEAEYYPERMAQLDDLRANTDPEDDFQLIRPPFLPHPEMRETIPNVSLNSVLYQLPQHLKTYSSVVDGHDSLTERQLSATVDFFDQCVPNQPGYTSSVVAATIIPDASLVTGAWMKWYSLGKKMRRLRYIKQILEERRQMQIDGVKGLHDYVGDVYYGASQAPMIVAKTTGKAVSQIETTIRGSAIGAERQEGDVVSNADIESGARNDTPSSDDGDSDDNHVEMGSIKGTTIGTGAIDPNGNDSIDIESPSRSDNEIIFENEKPSEKNGIGGFFSNLFGSTTKIETDESEADRRSKPQQVRSSSSGSKRLSAGSEGEFINHPTNVDEVDDLDMFKSTRQSASTRDSISIGGITEQSPSLNGAPGKENDNNRPSIATTGGRRSSIHFDYKEFNATDYAKWVGYKEETELDQLVDELGIEQLCVYAREMSQSASNPCVYGCGLKSLRLASVEELEDMLEEAWESVRQENAELLQVRADIFREAGQLDADDLRAEVLEEKIGQNTDTPPSVPISPPSTLPIVRESVNEENDDTNLEMALDNESDDEDAAIEIDPSNSLGEEGVPLTGAASTTGLRKRGGVTSTRAKYAMAQSLIRQMNMDEYAEEKKEKRGCCGRRQKFGIQENAKKTSDRLAHALDHPSYAVVTFTSRQSAIAARQCLADGRGVNRWSQVDDIPTAPIADAPPLKPFFFRGCCRPVTLTINYKEKKLRRFFVWVFYFFFCCLYTVPLALTSSLLNPEYLQSVYPDSKLLQNEDSLFYRVLAGFSSGALYSLFFSILPQVFKFLAFTEGVASSVPVAEDNALIFYWYFMLVTAFTGSTLATMLLEALTTGELQTTLKDALVLVARTIPTSQAPVWLNWMIVRTLYTLPMNYLCQAMTWLYDILPCKWLNRVMRGGGPGGPPPIRIPIDTSVVFMCLTSLAPVAPLIAPFATLHYLVFIPMLRWLNIFVYRPKYDGGGNRWPVYHQFLISALIWGQLLTATQLFLKQAIAPGALVVAMTLPTFFFSQWTQELFLQSYRDAGLLQTSQLDGWEHTETLDDREKYRRWLVDCHKASYVPICLSGGDDFLTVQPAVTVPTHKDDETATNGLGSPGSDTIPSRGLSHDDWKEKSARNHQKGALWKRYLD